VWPFMRVAAACSAPVLTAASLVVVTPLLDRAYSRPAQNPAAAAAPSAMT